MLYFNIPLIYFIVISIFFVSAKNGLCGDSLYNSYSYVTVNDNFMTFTLTTNPSPQIGTFDAIITNFHQLEGNVFLSDP